MPRLIDADALKSQFIKWLPKDPQEGGTEVENTAVSAIMEIEEAPTVYVDSRGSWICRPQQMVSFDPTGDEIEDWYECSACKYGYVQNKTQYCPGCGAKMDDSEKMGEGGRK